MTTNFLMIAGLIALIADALGVTLHPRLRLQALGLALLAGAALATRFGAP